MKLSKSELNKLAEQLGYRVEILEKVLWLLEILEAISKDPFLEPRLALKGGTALNLFALNLPRMSVDIDLNYIGSAEKNITEAERPKLLSILRNLCQRLGLKPEGEPDEHAGGKWHLSYKSQITDNGNIEIDLNFLQRLPLWETVVKDSHPLGEHRAKGIRVLDAYDLYGGKLTALLSRGVARDAFDAAQISAEKDINVDRLRLAFVVYGAASRTDWRNVKSTDVNLDLKDVQARLLPVLSKRIAPDVQSVIAWSAKLEKEARGLVDRLLPLKANELEFLEQLLGQGNILPALLTQDAALAERITKNPALTWKALNVKEYVAKGPKSPSEAKERRRRK